VKNQLYNKCKEGVWRLDVDIEEVRNVDAKESNGDNKEIKVKLEGVEEEVDVEGESDTDSLGTSDRGDWTSESEGGNNDEESDDNKDQWIEE
jgi:hypothetical protein